MLKALKILGIFFSAIGFCFLLAGLILFAFPAVPYPLQLIFVIFGIVFPACGIVMLQVRSYHIRKKERLLNIGLRTTAHVIEFTYDYFVSINHRHPFMVLCEGTDPFDGTTRIYTSESVWIDPSLFLSINSPVSVYVNPDKPKQYYVDLDSVLPCSK